MHWPTSKLTASAIANHAITSPILHPRTEPLHHTTVAPYNCCMAIKPEEIPDRPMTLTIVPMESAESNPNVFGFLCVFPSGTKFTVASVFPPGVVDVKMAKSFAARIVQGCLERGDHASVDGTNWASVTAMMQKLLLDFNNKRGAKQPGRLVRPDGTLIQ